MAKNIIKLNRGDSYEVKLKLNIPDKEDATKNYTLNCSDAIYFALCYPHQRFEEAIVIKGYDHTDYINVDEILIKIDPKDTVDLAPGIYYYTVKLLQGGTLGSLDDAESVRTIIERTKFIINE